MTEALKLLPEWHQSEAVILAWPDEQTDWAPWLSDVRKTYLSLIEAINQRDVGVLLLVHDQCVRKVIEQLPEDARVLIIPASYNDTWVRDYGFLTCSTGSAMQPVEFTFNGWGNKFNATWDNQVNRSTLAPLCRLPVKSFPLVAEGGAIEIDEQGHLLSTALCLTNPQRNGQMTLEAYDEAFKSYLGANITTFFQEGHLEGDDTDGHVDTLVRYTPHKGLVIQSCYNRLEDSHYPSLSALVQECREALPEHTVYELPLPKIENAQGERLPASYANYLICNQSILFPVYQQEEDEIAMKVIREAYPEFDVVAIDALPLVQQFGSIHCISMQVPQGTLKTEITHSLAAGVSVYEQ